MQFQRNKEDAAMKITWSRNTGLILLGVWLMATSASNLLDFRFMGRDTVLAVLALVAGGLIAFKR